MNNYFKEYRAAIEGYYGDIDDEFDDLDRKPTQDDIDNADTDLLDIEERFLNHEAGLKTPELV